MRHIVVRLAVLFACANLIGLSSLVGQEKGATRDAEYASVKEFGAVGDGKADDTQAIQKAIDSGRGDIRLPKGVYRVTQPIVVDLQKTGYVSISGNGVARVVMAGAGPAFQFLGTHMKSADPQGFAPEVWDRQRMPLVDGVAIVGEHEESEGIAASGTMQITVTRVHLRKLKHGIHLSGNNRNVLIADSHIYENHGIGVFYDDVNLHQSNITGCHISYCGGGGIVSLKGNVRNLHVTGCDIESNMSKDGPPTANVLIDCTDSAYGTGEVAITGCTIQHNNPSPESANIRIIGRSLPSSKQQVVQEGNVTITGNVFSDVKVNVHLRECRGVAITGNTFWQGYTYNLLIEDSSNIVIGSNNFDRNPRYDYGNTQDANNGLVFRNCSDCNVTGLHVTNVWREPAGVIIDRCRRMNVTNCTILDCQTANLLIKDSELCRISDCLIRTDKPNEPAESVIIQGGKGNVLVNNVWNREPKVDGSMPVLRENFVVE